jgi:hypothetical protein
MIPFLMAAVLPAGGTSSITSRNAITVRGANTARGQSLEF